MCYFYVKYAFLGLYIDVMKYPILVDNIFKVAS